MLANGVLVVLACTMAIVGAVVLVHLLVHELGIAYLQLSTSRRPERVVGSYDSSGSY